jgi:transcriptional regulator with XRE-family HTH domain
MQNFLLLHLREQKRLSPKQIELRTGIPARLYLEYENGNVSISSTDIELLAALFKVKSHYLKMHAEQVDFFTHSEGILKQKNKRLLQLTKALKRYIKAAPSLKPKNLKL